MAPKGSWEKAGVHASLASVLRSTGLKQPTPIQLETLPLSLADPARDVLGMARTGSGKTLAYLVPMIQRLRQRRDPTVKTRGLILCPNRELAQQVIRLGRNLSRKLSLGDDEGQDGLKWSLIVGGRDMESQFEDISSNPDIIVATPGRFLHIVVEMSLSLLNLEVVVYDEGDRLFEFGFEQHLTEIVHRLPARRQSLLFSATLSDTLESFAKMSLNNPILRRMDQDQVLSPDLKQAFFAARPHEKDGALFLLLSVLKGMPDASSQDIGSQQVIVFVSTKHHVEYLSMSLRLWQFRVAAIYGSLDQTQRQQQLDLFRSRQCDILVVTDVASRGIDIPDIDCVLNYDLPPDSKTYLHRVGRTARAGKAGIAWSLVSRDDMPYLYDIGIDLGVDISREGGLYGSLPQQLVDETMETVSHMQDGSYDLRELRKVTSRAREKYERSRKKPSNMALREAQSMLADLVKIPLPVHQIFTKSTAMDSKPVERVPENSAAFLEFLQQYRPSHNSERRGPTGHPRALHGAGLGKDSHRKTQKMPGPSQTTRHFTSYLDEDSLGAESSTAQSNTAFGSDDFASLLQASRWTTHKDDFTSEQRRDMETQRAARRRKEVSVDPVRNRKKEMIRGESGIKLPASLISGRFARWQKQGKASTSIKRRGK